MKIGLITDSLSNLPTNEALDMARDLQLSSVEFATGNWSEAPHMDLDGLLGSATMRTKFVDELQRRNLTISALNANGNQLHPVSGPAHDSVLRKTISLAALLDVPTVVCMSGLPAAKGDKVPNWITASWPPENLDVLEYQWNDVAIPYWINLAAYAREHNVKLAIEACFSQLVHSVDTLYRLAEAAGRDVVGANLDPSHLMWMGADIPTVVDSLGDAIIHVHAKDVRIEKIVSARNGTLDTNPMGNSSARAWNYVTLGVGHPDGESFWANFIYSLRSVGYDGTVNIEHEDTRVSSREGVTRAAHMLRRIMIGDLPDWRPAGI